MSSKIIDDYLFFHGMGSMKSLAQISEKSLTSNRICLKHIRYPLSFPGFPSIPAHPDNLLSQLYCTSIENQYISVFSSNQYILHPINILNGPYHVQKISLQPLIVFSRSAWHDFFVLYIQSVMVACISILIPNTRAIQPLP